MKLANELPFINPPPPPEKEHDDKRRQVLAGGARHTKKLSEFAVISQQTRGRPRGHFPHFGSQQSRSRPLRLTE
jgi:hypothetical protein